MRASRNRARIDGLHAVDNARLDAYVASDLAQVNAMPYAAYDADGDAQASPVMTLLRAMLQARVTGALYAQIDGDTVLSAIADLCVPQSQTHDDTQVGRAFYDVYANAAMRYATTRQLTVWLETYRARLDYGASVAHDVLARQALRGLAALRGYCAERGMTDTSGAAMAAILDNAARQAFSAQEHRAWHALTDSTHQYVGTGKLSKREYAMKHGHHARRKHERMAGKPAHH